MKKLIFLALLGSLVMASDGVNGCVLNTMKVEFDKAAKPIKSNSANREASREFILISEVCINGNLFYANDKGGMVQVMRKNVSSSIPTDCSCRK